MKDRDVDTHLRQCLSGDSPGEAFRQQVLGESTAEFVRVRRRRSAWRIVQTAAAAVLIAGIAFLGGRLSVQPVPHGSVEVAPLAAAEPEGVTVPSDLIAWLDAARLFRQLGMEDRMARAVERAGRLLPADTFIADDQTLQMFAAAGSAENQKEHVEPMDMPGPQSSVESINQILAQSLGD